MRRFFSALICVALVAPGAQAQLRPADLVSPLTLETVDAAIAANAQDPETAFDLLREKSRLQDKAGDTSGAAETLSTAAAFAARHPDRIDADLPTLLIEAGDLYREALELETALDLYLDALDAYRDRSASDRLMSALLERITGLETVIQGSDTVVENKTVTKEETDAPSEPDDGDAPEPELSIGVAPPTRSDGAGYVTIDVHYATDRAQSGDVLPARFYGFDRAEGLDYGVATVTIPDTHTPGALEAPSIWRLEFAPDPTRHVMLQSVKPVEKSAFFTGLNDGLNARNASDIFVFIHGYNVTFDGAAKRAAQLAYDMKFKGLPVLYSWPSMGSTIGYISDTAAVRLSGRRLSMFLSDLAAQSGATTIHIVAHSMGNRALTDALELMALREAPVTTPPFDQVIFAAPDVDQGLFREMTSTFRPLARRMTLYASSQDWALEASRKLHGNQPRAGQGGDGVLSHPQLDTVDMSTLGEDMLAHSYVANDRSALMDMLLLFWRNLDPGLRCGLKASEDEDRVWLYERDDCASADLMTMIASMRNAGARSRAEVQAVLRRDFSDAPQASAFAPVLLDLAAE